MDNSPSKHDQHVLSANPISRQHLIKEIQSACEPRQHALISMMVACEHYGLDTGEFIEAFANDLPRTLLEDRRRTRKFFWSRVLRLSERLNEKPAGIESLLADHKLLPDTVAFAIAQEHLFGDTGTFGEAWMKRTSDNIFVTDQPKPLVATIVPMLLKSAIILSLATFIGVWILPELFQIVEEFNLEHAWIAEFSVVAFELMFRFFMIPVLLLLIALPFFIPGVFRLFQRWNPFRWRQPFIPRSIERRRVLAAILQFGRAVSNPSLAPFTKLTKLLGLERKEGITASQIDWDELASKNILSRQEASAIKACGSSEMQAWLLRNLANRQGNRVESRQASWGRLVVTGINVLLGLIVIWMSLFVFSTLVSIISQMQ